MANGFTIPFWEQSGKTELKWRIIGDVIEQAITFGTSQNATASALRLSGFTFGNDPFRQLFRDKRDFRVGFEYTTTIDANEIPNPLQIPHKDWLDDGVIQYIIEYDTQDSLTGDITSHRTGITIPDLLTRDEIEGANAGEIESESPPIGYIQGTATLIGAFRGLI